MPRQDPLDKFRRADQRYRDHLAKTDTLRAARDAALLELASSRTRRELAAELGLSAGRVQQLVERARNA